MNDPHSLDPMGRGLPLPKPCIEHWVLHAQYEWKAVKYTIRYIKQLNLENK